MRNRPSTQERLRDLFGDGQHPTTRLCCELLDRTLQPGDRVLDVGTGPGTLAAWALRRGASEVVGIDQNAEAIQLARELVPGVRFEVADATSYLQNEGSFDVIVANLPNPPLLALVPLMWSRADRLVLSGVLLWQGNRLQAVLRNAGATVDRPSVAGGWCAFAAR